MPTKKVEKSEPRSPVNEAKKTIVRETRATRETKTIDKSEPTTPVN